MTYGQQQPGYAAPGPQLSVGDALGYGWEKFKNNALVWIGIIVVFALIQVAINFIFGSSGFLVTDADGDISFGFSLWGFLGSVISTVVGYLISAAMVRGSLEETDGRKPGFGDFFQFTNVGAVILACFLVGIATGIGFALCVLPGLVIMFFTWFTINFVLDRDQDAITAIKSSFSAVAANAGTLLLLALALVGINIVGALLCGIGLLVTMPVSVIASTYAYRVIVGGPVVGGQGVADPGYPQQYGGPAGGFGGQPGYGGPEGGQGYGGPGYGGPEGGPGYGGPGGPGYGGPGAGGPGYGGPGYPDGPDLGKPGDQGWGPEGNR
ncbi:hypothetical protein ACFWU5_10925 [Nocardia sp. NPDC058640]|uniref:hypothetical protein n=1 Tax=Nocardia sp. NPDC058640 TaxID=3346571 RepID=UPI00364BF659